MAQDDGETLAVFAIEKIAHRLSASFVRLGNGLAFGGIHAMLRGGVSRFGRTALRAAVSVTGFIGLQLELFGANDTHFDRKGHTNP